MNAPSQPSKTRTRAALQLLLARAPLLGVLVTPLHAALRFECPMHANYDQAHRFGSYVAKMVPGEKESPLRCKGIITARGTPEVRVAEEWAMSIDSISGK